MNTYRRKSKRPKGNFEAVGAILQSVLRKKGLGDNLERYRYITEWENIIGTDLAKLGSPSHITEGVLLIHTSDSMCSQELALREQKIIEKLNAFFAGGQTIHSIRFQVKSSKL